MYLIFLKSKVWYVYNTYKYIAHAWMLYCRRNPWLQFKVDGSCLWPQTWATQQDSNCTAPADCSQRHQACLPQPSTRPCSKVGLRCFFFTKTNIYYTCHTENLKDLQTCFSRYFGILWSSIVKETCNWLPREKHLVLMSNLWPGCFLGLIFMSLQSDQHLCCSLPR